MIIDCHYHYYEDEFCFEEKLADMNVAGIGKIALMAPVAAQFESNPDLIQMRFMRRLFGKRALMPLFRKLLCTFEGNKINVLGEQVPICFKPQNDGVFKMAEAHPDKFLAWAALNPSNCSEETLLQELNKWSGQETFIGVKAHPFYHQYNASLLEPVFSELESLQKQIIIHMGFDDMPSILALADKYKKVNIILAHCAFPYFDIMWPEIVKRSNIYVDISSSCYVDQRTVKRAVRAIGVKKCIYGSDGPYGPPNKAGRFDLSYQVNNTLSWFNEEARADVGYKNFLGFLEGTQPKLS